MGTPDYLSPEQAKNSHNVDSRSDLYSLGCTLFFLLTGKPPFASAQSLIDKLIAHTEDAPPPIRELRPDLPEGVAVVLEKLLAKKPDDRYDTAADVAVAIQPFIRAGAEIEPKPNELEAVAAPASGFGIGEDEGDTGPVARERTLTESERSRKSKRLRRLKARPWWEKTGVKIGAAVLLPLIVVIAIIIVGKAKGPSAADSTKAQPNPTATTVTKGKPAKALPFLFVVPSQGVHCPDYLPVKKRLNDAKIQVVTASGQGGFASPTPFDPNGSSVKIDVKIADVDALEYSGIAFTGFNVEEYIDTRAGGPHNPVTKATHNVIEKMVFLGKPVGAICVGEAVLAIHGVLDGKPVAKSPMLMKSFPRLQNLIPGATWQDQSVVVVDGRVITARGAPDAREFADALIAALKSE
jgi:serine/threonine-protein kinase